MDTPYDDDNPPPPIGVTLRDPEDSEAIRGDLENGVSSAMQRYVHGFEYGGVRLELSDMRYADKDKYSLAEQKEALMSDRLLARRLRATVKLVDVETNKPLDVKKNFTLARVPYLTQRGTFINNGNELAPCSQSRLLPGAYTRKRDGGTTECHFNVRPGSGAAMRVSMDPTTAQYRVKLGTSDLHAYSLFKDLGVTDDELERRWGKPILDLNKARYSKDTLGRAYMRAVPKWERDASLSPEDKAAAVRAAFDRAQVAESILKSNLPNLYSREKTAYWRMAGHALDAAAVMSKSASIEFSPDMTADAVMDSWQEFNFDLQDAVKEASFDPDLDPDDMRESYNSIYGNHGPRLASMRRWPEHWLDDQDKQGWLEWYKQYSAGRRSEHDDKQIERWKSFKRRHGAMFVRNPTPRRAFALTNWAIDPLELVPHGDREAVKTDMDNYKGKEYMKWYMNRHDFDEGSAHALGMKARDRGAELKQPTPDAGELMRLVLEGFIKPEDLT